MAGRSPGTTTDVCDGMKILCYIMTAYYSLLLMSYVDGHEYEGDSMERVCQRCGKASRDPWAGVSYRVF